MAFLRANPNNSGLRGRLAGQVYAADGEDTIVRVYEKPTYSPTPASLAVLGRFTDGSDAWGAALNDAQRADWAEAAKSVMSKSKRRIGEKAISGRSLFIGRFSKVLQAGGTAAPVEPPASRFKGDGAVFSWSHTTGNLVVSCVSEAVNDGGVTTEIRVQRLSESYTKPQGNGYRAKAFHAFTKESASVSLPVRPGSYSVSVQGVLIATGEIARTQVLGMATVAVAVAVAVGGKREGAKGKRGGRRRRRRGPFPGQGVRLSSLPPSPLLSPE